MSNQYFMNQPFWMNEMYYGHSGQPNYDQEPAAASYQAPHRPSQPQSEGNDGQQSQASSQLVNDVGVKVLSQSNKKEFKLYTLRRVSEDCMKKPTSIKNEIHEQLGNEVVSESLDFDLLCWKRKEMDKQL